MKDTKSSVAGNGPAATPPMVGAPGADPDGSFATTIVVNGRRFRVGPEVNHAQLVGLAHPDAVPAARRRFTVAFARGPAARPEGFVAPGDRIRVVEGQDFVVVVADQS